MGSWPPAPLRHPRFELWPSDPAMNAADFEAVMSSREMLQRWSASPWPEAGFTLAENAEDLAAHQADHRAGRIFGYNLTEPGGAGCLGSVYIRPNPPWAEDYVLTPATPGATLEGLDLKVELWVRSDTGDLEAVVLEALRAWFADAWGARPAFAVRPAHHERLALFRAGGFALVAHLGDDEGGVGSLLFAPPEALGRGEIGEVDGAPEAVARAYLRAIEAGDADAVAGFLHPEVQQIEWPNALNPAGQRRDREEMIAGVRQGAALLSAQRFEILHALSQPAGIALEMRWTGTLAVDAGPMRAGHTLAAHISTHLELRGGRILRQSNYDCFEPLPA